MRSTPPPVIVDYAIWANQQAAEIEPDVVLVTCMGHIIEPGQADSRIARLRVTDAGLALDHRGAGPDRARCNDRTRALPGPATDERRREGCT